MENLNIEELEALRLELTEDLRQNDMELIQCNNTITGSNDREVLERQRIIRLDLVDNKTYIINQLAEVKRNIKLHNAANNKPNNYGDYMKVNNAKLDEIILLLKRINHKMKVKK